MKIGILTYSFANNYGACLQAYALCEFLCAEGYDVELINYVTDNQKSNNSTFRKVTSWKEVIKNIARLFHKVEINNRLIKFQIFREMYHKIGIKICEGNFRKIQENYDILIVGSDQVWNPNVEDFDEVYILNFFNKPKMTYAVSLGNATANRLIGYESAMNAFQAISVREKSSECILGKLLERQDIVTVVDPVFLLPLEKWKNIANAKCIDECIVCYYLRRKGSIEFIRKVNQFAKKNKLNIVFINSNYGLVSWGKNVINDSSPQEFLGYISQAKYVFTNSFHAIAFSIIYKKNFYFINDEIKNDNRINDFLNMLKIKERVINNFDFSIVRDRPLEFDLEILNKNIEKSKKWLLDSLLCLSKEK